MLTQKLGILFGKALGTFRECGLGEEARLPGDKPLWILCPCPPFVSVCFHSTLKWTTFIHPVLQIHSHLGSSHVTMDWTSSNWEKQKSPSHISWVFDWKCQTVRIKKNDSLRIVHIFWISAPPSFLIQWVIRKYVWVPHNDHLLKN